MDRTDDGRPPEHTFIYTRAIFGGAARFFLPTEPGFQLRDVKI